MKSVLISIQPKWCKLIASGKKTVEVRKTRPNIKTPFKCYIYCTKDNTDIVPSRIWWKMDKTGFQHILNGMVIGEFVCDKIIELAPINRADEDIEKQACLSREQIVEYLRGKGWAWHISDLVIYDKPKELGEFFHACDKPKGTDCSLCVDRRENKCKSITRPPQSWCYVERR